MNCIRELAKIYGKRINEEFWVIGEDECVHHINHKRDDNRLCNLRLMTKSEHMSMHMKERFKKC